MWIKSALGSIGKAFKKAIESFNEVKKEVSNKILTAVNRIVESKDTPKGTKSKVEIRENQIKIEIETPDKAIKDDIRKSAEQAEKKVEWRMSEHAKELAEQNTLKSLHEKYVHGEFIDPKKFLKDYDITDPKNLFSQEKFESARGYIWKVVAEKMEQNNIWDNVYQRAKQLILEKRHMNFFSYDELADDYKTLRENYGSHTGEKFQQELDRIAENIIDQLNSELRDKTTREVENIINQYKKQLHFVLDFDIMIVNARGFQNMKDFDTIKKVQMFMNDANVSTAVKEFADANPELVKSKVALMNVFNGRTNGDVKGLFAKFLDFYVARINKYVGVSNE